VLDLRNHPSEPPELGRGDIRDWRAGPYQVRDLALRVRSGHCRAPSASTMASVRSCQYPRSREVSAHRPGDIKPVGVGEAGGGSRVRAGHDTMRVEVDRVAFGVPVEPR